jgi:hypothetical protein
MVKQKKQKNKIFRIEGQVLNRKDKKGVPGLRVQAWDKDKKYDQVLGSATTDAKGYFLLEFNETDFKDRCGDTLPDVYFKIFLGDQLIKNTEDSVICNLASQETIIIMEVDIPNDKPEQDAFIVRGRVTQPNGNPVTGAYIRTVDKRLQARKDVVLGKTETNEDGFYEIKYKATKETAVDLVVQVLDRENKVVKNSPLILEAAKELTVDIVIHHEAYPDLSEYDQLNRRLKPFLKDISPGELDNDSLALLAGKTRINPGTIAYLIQADRLEKETKIPAEAYYGMFRAKLPFSLPALAAQDKNIQKKAIETAASANIIGKNIAEKADEILSTLDNCKVEEMIKQPELPAGQMSLGTFLDIAGLKTNQKKTFANLFSKHTGSSKEFWTCLRKESGFDDKNVKAVQLSIQLGMLTLDNAPLMETLHKQLRQGNRSGLRDLIGKSEEEWREIICQHKDENNNVIVPKNLPVVEGQEPETVYARTMMNVIEDAYPTPTIAFHMKNTDFAGADTVKTFLDQHPDFEFRGTSIGRYIREQSLELPAKQRENIEAVQRLFSISPRVEKYSAMQPLLKNGLTSAYAVRALDEEFFSKSYVDVLGKERTTEMYHAAGQKLAVTASLFAGYSPLFNNIFMTVIPKWEIAKLFPNYPEIDFPTWESLFGSIDFCTCRHCRSVYSPAAYLVDMLAFLKKYNKGGKTALAVLFQRRGDIGKIELNCHNTNTTLPYTDLVIEVLEHYVAGGTTWWDSSAVPQTEGQAEDLRVHPEHINDSAYLVLETTAYPWTLPFSLRGEEIRAYLEPLDVKRETIMRYFNIHYYDALPDGEKDAVAAEHLGLIDRERSIILGNIAAGAAGWGGTAVSALRNVKTLLERGRMTYLELRRLLETRYINGSGTLKVEFPVPDCNLSEAKIPALQQSHADKIHRFMRLKRKLGWEIQQLDAVLDAFSPGNISDSFLRKLSTVVCLREKLETGLITILSWWSNINTSRWKDENDIEQPSLYDTLFLNKTIGDEADIAIFKLNASRDELADPGKSIDDYQAAILAALRIIKAEDLLLIRQKRLTNDLLNMANLSELHRTATFAQALELTIRDFLYFVDLMNRNPFDSNNPDTALSFVEILNIIKESDFTIPGLAYILYHETEAGIGFVPGNEEIGIFLLDLRTGLQKIHQDFQYAPDPTGERTAQFLAQVLSEEALTPAMGLIYGISAYDMPADPGTFIDDNFAVFISDLQAIKDKLVNTANADYLKPEEKQTRRFQVVLEPLMAYLKETNSVSLVKQTFSDFLDIELNAADLLIGGLIKAVSDNTKPAFSEFVNDTFIQSPQEEITEVNFGNHFKLIHRLHKAATLIKALDIPSDELTWLVNDSPQLGWLDFNALPVDKNGDPARFQEWLRMARFSALQAALPSGEPSLFELLRMGHWGKDDNGSAVDKDTYLTRLCGRTRWNKTDIEKLMDAEHFNLNFNDNFKNENSLKQLLRFFKCLSLLKHLGVSAEMAWQWAHLPTSTAEEDIIEKREAANQVKQAAKAKYDEHQWLSTAEPIRDELRKKQRTALIDACLHRVNLVNPDIKDVDDLFGFFLMDVEMNPCMITSRIKQSLSSVQLFIQRCLMNLEDGVGLGTGAANQWKWMKNYRVWEANRKIFLYPENWVEPELRPGKSPFFIDLENELLQNDVTKDTAEIAFLNYLEKLDEVARLEVASVYNDDETGTLHVIGRTKGIPHKYYYRRWEKGRCWTAWESVPIDVEGENVAVTYYNRRLYLFWFMVQEKADDTAIDSTTVDTSKDKNTLKAQAPKKYLEIKLAWTQYRSGKWSPKRLSDVIVKTEPSKYPTRVDQYRPRTLILKNEKNSEYLLIGVELSNYTTYLDSDRLESKSNFLFVNDGQVELAKYDPDRHIQTRMAFPGPWLVSRRYHYFPQASAEDSNINLNINITGERSGILLVNISRFNIPRVIIPLQHTTYTSQAPFFFEDRTRSYFVTPRAIYRDVEIKEDPPIFEVNPGIFWEEDVFSWDDIYFGNLIDPREVEPGPFDFGPVVDVPTEPGIGFIKPQIPDVVIGVEDILAGSPLLTHNFLAAENVYGTNSAINVIGGTTGPPLAGMNTMSIPASGNVRTLAVQPMMSLASSPSAAASTASLVQGFVMNQYDLGNAGKVVDVGKAVGAYLSRVRLYIGTRFRFHTFYHPYVNFMIKQLNRHGIDGLLNPVEHGEAHHLRRQLLQEKNSEAFDSFYTPGDDLDRDNLPVENFDFEYSGAYSIYNWELFFHAPFLIAARLSANQQFEEAQKWFHYIFDPTDVSDVPADKNKYRFWKIKPFYENTDTERIETLLRLLNSNDPSVQAKREALAAQIADWRENPFQPHLIAQQRIIAYQKAIVMKYIDNLIAWGDHLFRRDTIESVNEATQLYILAAQILGKRPEKVPAPKGNKVIGGKTIKTFNDLEPHLDAFSNAFVKLETELPASAAAGESPYAEAPTAQIIGSTLFFCIPKNDKLLGYWDTVADRLFKIRNCMNIEGVVRQLKLFEPPIDPAMLVRAAAAGIDLSSVLNDMNAPLPHYRFSVMLQKAIELCGDVKQLGGALLSAIEKRDAEEMALLRSSHEETLLNAVKRVRELQLNEAKETLKGLEKNLESAKSRHNFYAKREPRIPNEKLHLDKLDAANTKEEIAQGLMIVKTALTLIPQIDLGASGFGGSPVIEAEFGGIQLGDALDAASQVLSFLAMLDRNAANRASIVAGYDRRQEEWDFQAEQAAIEIEALKKQIEASGIRINIAEKELGNQELQIEQNREVDEMMRSKFSNKELYNWMITQVSTIYFQSYQLAYDMAKRAQKAFQHELADYGATFIQFGYWDSLKKGLLAGERLHYDLRRMESAYYDSNRREYELTKHISLTQINPTALIQLQETGTCEIDIPEVLFDIDYPGHYVRRIKSASLSIPCVAGPYTTVNCTLTLLSNRIRVSTDNPTDAYTGLDDNRFISNIGGIQSIATSSAREDGGLFEFNFRDERYLPFEGAGVVGRWRLELPGEYRQFDYDTISDIILHIRYTSREGGANLKTTVLGKIDDAVDKIATATSHTGLFHFISMKREFGSAFHKFFNLTGTGDHQTSITISKKQLPYLLQRKTPDFKDVLVFVKLRNASLYDDSKPLALTISRNGGTERNQPFTAAGEALGGLAHGTYTNLNGILDSDETWQLSVKANDIQNLTDAMKPRDEGGNLIQRINGDEIEDIGILINYKIA